MAFPLISAGVYRYPKDQALRVAVETIQAFLRERSLTVYLVLFDQAAFQLCGKLFPDLTPPRADPS